MNKYVLWALNSILLITAVMLIGAAIPFAEVNRDAGYILPMAQGLAKGLVLYRDLDPSHLTSVMFFYAIEYRLFGATTPYWISIATVIACEVFAAVLVYMLARRAECSKAISVFSGLLCLVTSLNSEGIYIVLEPFSVVFILLSLLVIDGADKTKQIVLAGLLGGIAFTTKQYAGVVLPLLIISIWTNKKVGLNSVRLSFVVIASFAIIPLAYYGSIWGLSGKEFKIVVIDLFGVWYTKYPGQVSVFMVYALTRAPYLPINLFLLPKLRSSKHLFFVVAFMLSALPSFVRQYGHYYIFCAPFAALLGGLLITHLGKLSLSRSFGRSLIAGVIVGGTIVVGMEGAERAFALYKLRPRQDQVKIANEINKAIPRGSIVLNVSQPYWPYLCGFTPANSSEIGYNFLILATPLQVEKALSESIFVLAEPGYEEYTRFNFSDSKLSVTHHLVSSNPMQIWERTEMNLSSVKPH